MPAATRDATAGTVGGEWTAALDALREQVTSLTGLPVLDDASAAGEALAALVQPVGLTPLTGAGPAARTVSTADVRVTVLVTVVGGDPVDRAARMTDLALSALADGAWDVDPQGPQPWLWRSLALPARPGLLVHVPVRRLLHRAVAPRVRSMRVENMPFLELTGRVVTDDGSPVPSAVVAVLPNGPDVTTDRRGRFGIRAAVAAELGLRVRVAARGASTVLRLEPAPDGALGDLTLPGLVP